MRPSSFIVRRQASGWGSFSPRFLSASQYEESFLAHCLPDSDLGALPLGNSCHNANATRSICRLPASFLAIDLGSDRSFGGGGFDAAVVTGADIADVATAGSLTGPIC